MKKLALVIPAVATLLTALPSCVVPYAGVGVSTGYGYYDTLPYGYSSPYYYQSNRYYYGGLWEPGRYSYQGRYYDGRYNHHGHYYYGGRYCSHYDDHHHRHHSY